MSDEKEMDKNPIEDAIRKTDKKPPQSPGIVNEQTTAVTPPLPEIPENGVAKMQEAMGKYGDQEPIPMTPQPRKKEDQGKTFVSNLTAPVSNTIPLPANSDSTLELPASPRILEFPAPLKIVEKEQKPLLDFIESSSFSPNWTRQQLLKFDSGENLWPSPNIWHLPPQTDLGKMMFDVVRSPDYVQKNWPALRVVMGNCIDNTEWTCGVLCFFALCSVLGILGRVQEAFDDLEAGRL